MYHLYSMWQIAKWIIHWQVQHIKDVAPYINPTGEPSDPPVWWHNFYSDWDWYTNFYANQVPTPTLIDLAMRGTWRLIGLWVEEVGEWIREAVESNVRGWIGYVNYNFYTFSDWIHWLEDITGGLYPLWSSSLHNAVSRLYQWLPTDIVNATATWLAKFEHWYHTGNAWAWGQFEAAKTWVNNTAPWLVSGYRTVRNWYDSVGTWVMNFRNNPYGTIAGWLGSPWVKWVVICDSIVSFYNNVWIDFQQDMYAFFDHPMLWLYDKTEDYLCERW